MYRWCAVYNCENTTVKTPDKLWFIVPTKNQKMRKHWLKLAKRDPKSLSKTSVLYFCEDHFDVEKDMKNYMEYKVMGSVKRVLVKPTCVPTRFDCLSEERKDSPASTSQMVRTRKHVLAPPTCNRDYIGNVAASVEVEVSRIKEEVSEEVVHVKQEPVEYEGLNMEYDIEKEAIDVKKVDENKKEIAQAEIKIKQEVIDHQEKDVLGLDQQVYIREELVEVASEVDHKDATCGHKLPASVSKKRSPTKKKENIPRTTYRCCVASTCKNTTIKTPGKLWIYVPSADLTLRSTWLRLARRDPEALSVKAPLYLCEDHFDLEKDMENYRQYKIMGSVTRVRMRPDCVPTKFVCHKAGDKK